MPFLLLDTNVISELMKPAPAPAVQGFLADLDPGDQFTAAICLAELNYGIDRLPPGKRQQQLRRDLASYLTLVFPGRIIAFDGLCATFYGQIRAARDRAGNPITIADAMIAATARAHDLTLATRNTRDFANCGIKVTNPWGNG